MESILVMAHHCRIWNVVWNLNCTNTVNMKLAREQFRIFQKELKYRINTFKLNQKFLRILASQTQLSMKMKSAISAKSLLHQQNIDLGFYQCQFLLKPNKYLRNYILYNSLLRWIMGPDKFSMESNENILHLWQKFVILGGRLNAHSAYSSVCSNLITEKSYLGYYCQCREYIERVHHLLELHHRQYAPKRHWNYWPALCSANTTFESRSQRKVISGGCTLWGAYH